MNAQRPACAVCRVPIDCPCLKEGHMRPKMRTCAIQWVNGLYPQSRLLSSDVGPGAHLVHMCGRRCDNLLKFCDPMLKMMKAFGKVTNLCEGPFCERKGTLKCARCLSAYYCSKNFQRLNWREHKLECTKPPPESFREWVYTNIRENVTRNDLVEAGRALEIALGKNPETEITK